MVLLQHEQRLLEQAPLDETLPQINVSAAAAAKVELVRRVSYAVARAVKVNAVDEVQRLVSRYPETCAMPWPVTIRLVDFAFLFSFFSPLFPLFFRLLSVHSRFLFKCLPSFPLSK